MEPPNPSDPLALIVAAGAAIISFLAGIVLMLISARVKMTQRSIEILEKDIAGQSGLFVRLTAIEGRMTTAETNIRSLENEALTKQMFEQSIESQNATLNDLREEGRALDRKVDRINLQLASRPWSQTTMPAAHPREEDSDRPRPKLPSKPTK